MPKSVRLPGLEAARFYAASMILRYAVWMTIRPDQRWTGDLIPVVFHIVLASFLLVVAHHHRTRVRGSRPG